MSGNLAVEQMSGIDNRLHLRERQLLAGSRIGQRENASSRGDLYDVGSILHRVSNCPSAVFRTCDDAGAIIRIGEQIRANTARVGWAADYSDKAVRLQPPWNRG